MNTYKTINILAIILAVAGLIYEILYDGNNIGFFMVNAALVISILNQIIKSRKPSN